MGKREVLENLRNNKKLLARYEKLLTNLKTEYVADVVKDYRFSAKGIPVKIEGYNVHAVEALKNQYIKQKEKVQKEILKAEIVIASVESATDRLILSLRYVDGYKIREIADEMNYSEQAIRYRLHNLLKS